MITFKISGKELAEELGKTAGFAATQANWFKQKMESGDDPMRTSALAFCDWQKKARRFDWMARHLGHGEMHHLTEAEAKSLELL